MAEHIVDPTTIVEEEFQLTAGTTMGTRYRACPSCNKNYKTERLGEHVKKYHPAFWEALFTVDTLQASIDNKALVACKVAEKDHDQNFLICLACDSLRTTDRNHFEKNGEAHSNQHYDAALKLIAKKKGVAYVPKAKTDMNKLMEQLDKYRRRAKECERDHGDISIALCEKEEAQENLLKSEAQQREYEENLRYRTKKEENTRKALSLADRIIKDLYTNIPSTGQTDKFAIGLGHLATLLRELRANI